MKNVTRYIGVVSAIIGIIAVRLSLQPATASEASPSVSVNGQSHRIPIIVKFRIDGEFKPYDLDTSEKEAGLSGQRKWIDLTSVLTGISLPDVALEFQIKTKSTEFSPWLPAGTVAGANARQYGDKTYVVGGELTGFAMRVTGVGADRYRLAYRGHFSNVSDTDWMQSPQQLFRGNQSLESLRVDFTEVHKTALPPVSAIVPTQPNTGIKWPLVAMLLLTVFAVVITFRKISVPETAMWILRVILALSAAGIAYEFAGDIKGSGRFLGLNIQASGAFVVFLVVLFLDPRKKRKPREIRKETVVKPVVEMPSPPARRTDQPLTPKKVISSNAFAVLCFIFEEDGEATDERIAKELTMSMPEVELHVARLYEKCFISYPGDGLDDPLGYRILPDGTEYVLKNRSKRA